MFFFLTYFTLYNKLQLPVISTTSELSHINVWQKPLQYCKIISLQLKLIKFKYKIRVHFSHWEES